MRIAVEAVDEDDVDKTPTDGSIDLREAETTDLWSYRGSLGERRSLEGENVGEVSDGRGNVPLLACKR